MQIPQIRLQQTPAKIGIRTTEPVQEIEQKPADLLIKQTPATMTINRQPAQLEIDQEEAWNQLNLKMPGVFSADMAEFSKQEGLKAIAEISQKGDRLAAIKHKGDAIVAIATEKVLPPPSEFNIAFIPSYGSVRIDYHPTELQIEWEQGGAEIDSTQHRPIHTYIPGKIEVYLRQMQQLQIDFVGLNVNKKQ
jgi:hypothetical protein